MVLFAKTTNTYISKRPYFTVELKHISEIKKNVVLHDSHFNNTLVVYSKLGVNKKNSLLNFNLFTSHNGETLIPKNATNFSV